MKKAHKVMLVVFLILLGLNVIQHVAFQRCMEKRYRYQNNMEVLLTEMDTLEHDTSQQAYKIKALSLSLDEYKKYRAEDTEEIKKLKQKLKNIVSASKQDIQVEIPIHTALQDSLIKLENDHISFTGMITNNMLDAQINIPITLKQMVCRIPKHKFLWWSWGCKGFSQIVTTDNPYVKLNYLEYIELR